MLFQTFDDKEECISVFAKNRLIKSLPLNLSKTWSYAEYLKGHNIQYAQLYCKGQSLNEVCPTHIEKEWEKVNNKLKAFYRASQEAKLDLSEHCFFDMVPEAFLRDYAAVKNKICNYVFQNYQKPLTYDFSLELAKVLTEIKNRKLNIDEGALNNRLAEYKVREFVKKIRRTPAYISYDAFKTKTGRLSTFSSSFPILTMHRDYRKVITPNNDWLVEFDFNAAELRVMLGLLGLQQPKEDIHEWNMKNVFEGVTDRKIAKKNIFAWLYGSKKDKNIESVYNRAAIKQKYWDGQYVNTIFNRQIEADDFHSINYTIQSTAADLFLRQMIKVWKLLEGKKSYVAFSLHDSLIIDFSDEDQQMINEIKEVFANTSLGKFKVSANAGKNFGEMRKLNIH